MIIKTRRDGGGISNFCWDAVYANPRMEFSLIAICRQNDEQFIWVPAPVVQLQLEDKSCIFVARNREEFLTWYENIQMSGFMLNTEVIYG